MIPLVRPLIPNFQTIEYYFQKSKETGKISNFGPCFDELTLKLDAITGSYSLPVATGTAAIQIAIQTHFERGSKIGIPDYTHIGTLQAVTAAGCIPILLPVNRYTWTVDLEVLKKCFIELDGAIIVSPFGYHVSFEEYDQIAAKRKKILIYDLAGAWGINPKTKNTVCYSLHATKNFSCGEGGLICFSRKADYLEAKRLINFDTLPDRSVNSPWGSNLKLDELKCAYILAQLEPSQRIAMAERLTAKRMLIRRYQVELCNYCIPTNNHLHGAPSLAVIGGVHRASKIEEQCAEQGFMAKRYYPLLSSMPGISSVKCLLASSKFFETCLALPSDVTEEEVKIVVQGVKNILGRTRT